jgi:hypothetical protein
MQAVTLALSLASFILSIFAAGLAGFAVLRTLADKQAHPGVKPDSVVELDLPKEILDQLPDRKAPQQSIADYTRMLREAAEFEE